MLRLIYLSITLVVIILGVAFAVLNADSVQLNYYLGSIELPLSLVLVMAMIAGALLGIFASLSLIIGSRRKATKLKHSVEVAEKEILNLRNIPIKDEH
ncbi:MAG: LapA family protein [Gammaproteobacteria bacterium]|nr:LapA family protein [Gammaproteobacteria bacterium]